MAAPVITPAGAAKRGKEVQQFASDQSAKWTSTAGPLYNDAGATVPYTPNNFQLAVYLKCKNESGTFAVSATNAGAETGQAAVAVTSVVTQVPSFTYSGRYGKDFLEFVPEAGDLEREVIEKGGIKYTVDMTANARRRAEFLEFLEHFKAHFGTEKNFYYAHPNTATEYLMKYDAELKEEWSGANLVGYATVMKEV